MDCKGRKTTPKTTLKAPKQPKTSNSQGWCSRRALPRRLSRVGVRARLPNEEGASPPGTRAAPLRSGHRARAEDQSWALARQSIALAARAEQWARLGKRC